MLEKLKKINKSLSLRKFFILIIFTTFIIVIFLSLLCIYGGIKFRDYLLPDSNTILLTLVIKNKEGQTYNVDYETKLGEEMSSIPALMTDSGEESDYISISDIQAAVVKAESSLNMLTPKRKIAYQGAGILMVVLPIFFSVIGIIIAGFIFYRKKLYEPLRILSDSMEEISNKNLDFKLYYDSNDEMGRLCSTFEDMRQTLERTYKELWKMIEERKMIQASVAHDLRNPITIIKGYTEYLQVNLEKKTLSNERMIEIIDNINKTTERLESYTNSIRTINQLEDMEITRKPIHIEEFVENASKDLSLMTKSKKIKLNIIGNIPNGIINVDTDSAYRIIENIISNALRYAKNKIDLSFEIDNNFLVISIIDDGIGFPKEVLNGNNKLIISTNNADGHYGLGLIISSILCKKNDGKLKLYNNETGGAVVKIMLKFD